MATILVVDDDPQVRDALSVALPFQWEAATVVTAPDGENVLDIIVEENPDVILLDVSLPGLSGFEVLQRIRRVSDVPIIMLTGHGDETDQVHGLTLGADDYVVKPFSALALMARIRAVLRRTQLSSPSRSTPEFVDGPLTINFQSRRVVVRGRPVHLTPVEFKLLYHLARNAGHVLTHEVLLHRIWGPDSVRTHDHLRVYVSRVRSKIERAGGPDCIETERGIGYRFVRSPVNPGPAGGPRPDPARHDAECHHPETEIGATCPLTSCTE
jgi:two-component system, OmpR family, KDP operon response regulator KdpE